MAETLDRLAATVGGSVIGDPGVSVSDVTHDSRQAGAGILFVAIRGFSADGHEFVAEAIEGGAVAVAVDHPLEVAVPQLVVEDTRTALAPLAATVHRRPSEELDVVGVTGTNGKTSVTFLVESICRTAGVPAGLIGTIQTRVDGEVIPTLRTTPEASDLQRLLRTMADRGARTVAMEVSSHALALGRVDETRFAVAAFTNLSQDHLDFHGDMDSYFDAKASLFDPDRADRAVIWVDDPKGAELAARGTMPVTTVATERAADVSGTVLGADLTGTDLEVVFPGGGRHRVRLPIPGRFNVDNALVAAACALALGLDEASVVAGLADASPVPGRFEVVSGPGDPVVVVDYAHTPAGIAGAIASARRLGAGRVIALVGAGGERDRGKRPAMGAAAADADLVVVTSDNPRSEDPGAIIDAVMDGIPVGTEVVRIVDRREAIGHAVAAALPGDVVLVLGKGHERGQEIGGRVLPFDDRVVARTVLRDRREGGA
jgi:UDP-N-acetylmuramoyl-L-alanyl-D-glutamate--2,6-diaminopimelate ligase